MTQEEKAKAYDNLVERLKDLKFAYRFSPLSDTIEEKFPELAESEDERVIKSITRLIKAFYDVNFPTPEGFSRKELLAWLEKQGNLMKALQISNAKIGELIEKNYYLKEQLEKQGEQKPTVEMKTPEESLGIDSDTYNKIVDECVYGEQKSIKEHNACEFCEDRYGCVSPCSMKLIEEEKPVDKIEPKFKVGDWVVKGDTIAQILDIQEQYYVGLDINGKDFTSSRFLNDDKIHLWTIQDANDGDVLSWDDSKCITIFKNIYDEYSFNSYGFVGGCTGTFESRMSYHDIEGAHPATKEQHDLLFQKMKEAGYEWDAEKKELKKIVTPKFKIGDTMRTLQEVSNDITSGLPVIVSIDEEYYHCTNELIAIKEQDDYEYPPMNRRQNLANSAKTCKVEQNPAWSEEDENAIQVLKDIVKHSNEIDENIYTIPLKDTLYDWLKSLRPQSQWKPSEEQMDALRYVTNFDYGGHKSTLVSLYEQLKKLK